MINPISVGDVLSVQNRVTEKDIFVVVTKIIFKDNQQWLYIRRQDNKAFSKKGEYNIWIKGGKVEVKNVWKD